VGWQALPFTDQPVVAATTGEHVPSVRLRCSSPAPPTGDALHDPGSQTVLMRIHWTLLAALVLVALAVAALGGFGLHYGG